MGAPRSLFQVFCSIEPELKDLCDICPEENAGSTKRVEDHIELFTPAAAVVTDTQMCQDTSRSS